ncbi:GATA zinc finger domain-containing protein 4-like [Condylostylus longicornis]|uniref:GATA zinc finger domain-containing protein 4-like n=1 Tax=Condylostylus longicornis TaxID=2530218 RepID=UPI00244DAB71|nr:GATA zinc finger domain-containing protein 4-like [Condylostylus longicornis]
MPKNKNQTEKPYYKKERTISEYITEMFNNLVPLTLPENMGEQSNSDTTQSQQSQGDHSVLLKQYESMAKRLEEQQQELDHLKSNNVLEYIRKEVNYLKPFNGEEQYSITSFIRTVEDIINDINPESFMYKHIIKNIFNEKIQGNAKTKILDIEDSSDWVRIKERLKSGYKPKIQVTEISAAAFNMRVSSIEELITQFDNLRCKANELYYFSEKKNVEAGPEIIDHMLVLAIKRMIGGIGQRFVRNISNYQELKNELLELGDCGDIIRNEFRKPFNRSDSNNKNFRNQTNIRNPGYNRNFNYNSNNQVRNHTFFQNQANQQNLNRIYNSNQNTNQFRERYNSDGHFRNYNKNSGQFRNRTNSGQFRYNSNYNNNSNITQVEQSNNGGGPRDEPMDVSNIEHEQINFQEQPRETDSP